MCAADYDFREIASNWMRAFVRLGLKNALVYALDAEAHAHLTARGVRSVDGSLAMADFNRTRLARHIQRAEAERHLAAAAVAASGVDVLLMDCSHVLLRDAAPLLHEAAHSVDVSVPRGNCDGRTTPRSPAGCNPNWSLVWLRGAGSAEQRSRAVAHQVAGVRLGMVDFYLRWWNGAHCILNGFGKLFSNSRPSLADAPAAGSTAVVTMPGGPGGGTRVGLLPLSFFDSPLLYGQQKRSGAAIERAAKPAQRDRLRLDRYDEQDFVELVSAMKENGLWFL